MVLNMKLLQIMNTHKKLLIISTKIMTQKNFYFVRFQIAKNLSIHTNHNVYFVNITNTNLNENDIIKRLFDIIYLDLQVILLIF